MGAVYDYRSGGFKEITRELYVVETIRMGAKMKKILINVPRILKMRGTFWVIIFIAILCIGQLHAQDKKGKIDGLMYLANDQTIVMNANIIKILTDNLDRIASISGKETIMIPVAKEFKKRIRTRMVDGFMVQYAYTGSDVTLQKPKTKYIEFDFTNKTIKEKSANHDNDDPFRPSDTKLKNKVKEKDDKKP